MPWDDVTVALGPPELLTHANASSVAFVDVTSDGVTDLLTQSYSSPICARERASGGTYGPFQPVGGHTGPFGLAALDPSARRGPLPGGAPPDRADDEAGCGWVQGHTPTWSWLGRRR